MELSNEDASCIHSGVKHPPLRTVLTVEISNGTAT